MITIQQDFSISELNSLLAKFGSTTLDFNKQAILEDIERLKKDLEVCKSSNETNKIINKNNLTNIIAYLEKLAKKAETNEISIGWTLSDNIVKSYPIEMKCIPEYRVYTTDYINLNNEKVIHLDYSELADIIAFEIMYRDLDETHQSVEDKLQKIGVVAIAESKELTQHFTESPYKLSKMLHISDSPYLIIGKNSIIDYFSKKEFKPTAYREVVSHSCRSAMAFILEALLQKCSYNNFRFKICGVFDTGIYLLVDNHLNSFIENQLNDSVYIRTFGRKLEVKPKIQIF